MTGKRHIICTNCQGKYTEDDFYPADIRTRNYRCKGCERGRKRDYYHANKTKVKNTGVRKMAKSTDTAKALVVSAFLLGAAYSFGVVMDFIDQRLQPVPTAIRNHAAAIQTNAANIDRIAKVTNKQADLIAKLEAAGKKDESEKKDGE